MAFMVNVKPTGVEVAFEVGSLKEACDILQTEANALTELMGIRVNDTPGGIESAPPTNSKTTRKPKPGPDPSTASAPPPAPVPTAAPMPPLPADGSIPEALRRTPPPPPLVAAPPPPLAPPAPVPCELARKTAAEFNRRAAGAVDEGKAMLDWVYSTGLVIKGANVQEATDCLEMQTEDKIRPVAAALQVG